MAEAQAPAAPAPAAPPPPPVNRGVPDPVLRIQAILDAEREPAPEQQQAAPQLGEAPGTEAAQPEADAPAGPNKQAEGEEQQEPEGGEDSTPAPAEIPLDQLESVELEVTTKGENGADVVEKLPIKELKLGYMRQKDYQRKTAEVANQRREVESKIRQGVEGERTQYVQTLQQLQQIVVDSVAPELKNVDWNHLAQNDTYEYVRLRNRADQINQVLSQVQAKQQEAAAKAKADRDAAMRETAIKARETLEADIPGFDDGLYQTLLKSGESVGYKPEEVATWVDARAIKLLHKAHLYDQLQAGKTAPAPVKKVAVPPKVIKPGTAGNVSRAQQQDSNAMKRLQGSGKIEDAAAVIRSRLG